MDTFGRSRTRALRRMSDSSRVEVFLLEAVCKEMEEMRKKTKKRQGSTTCFSHGVTRAKSVPISRGTKSVSDCDCQSLTQAVCMTAGVNGNGDKNQRARTRLGLLTKLPP